MLKVRAKRENHLRLILGIKGTTPINMEQTTIIRRGMATRMREHNEKDERTERNINNGVENTIPKGIRIVS